MNNHQPTTDIQAALQFSHAWAAAACGVPLLSREVTVECCQQGWGVMQFDRSIISEPICLAGKIFKHGFGTHADSTIRLRTGQPIRRIRLYAGMDDNRHCRQGNRESPARLLFTVNSGGREIWRSPVQGIDSPPARMDMAVDGVQELLLNVQEVAGCISYTHADWADMELELADGTIAKPGKFSSQLLPQTVPPFTFNYGGHPVTQLLPTWQVTRQPATRGDDGTTTLCTTWRDPQTGLECRLELQEFEGFPAVEWVLYLKNTGTSDTPLIENIKPLNITWSAPGETLLGRSQGSPNTISDFAYQVDPLAPGQKINMAAGGGRSSNHWLPFFNLQTGDAGVILSIGWSGQWAMEFDRDVTGCVHLRGGQELTKLVLHPGEEIRSPRILLLFWNGQPQHGHNLFRQFILAHHTPQHDGLPLQGPLTTIHWGGMKTSEHLTRIKTYQREKLDYDYYWIDAGWYGPPDSYSPDEFSGDWSKHVGNWSINPVAHPQGLRVISDAAIAAGMKFLLWFEPERAIVGTPLTIDHPDWFLGERKTGTSILLNLGLPEARRWLTDYISNFIDEQGVHLYRQDFNFDPLPFWRAADASDRQGMAEIRYVEGLYAFWDELLRRHRGLIIDNCSSGGRRIDLETISRSIPLWRSDWQCLPDNDPIGGQVHGMGLSYWVPLHGTGYYGCIPQGTDFDTYRVRSMYGPALAFSLFPYEHIPIRDDYPWDWHRARLAEYRRAQPLFVGDYYPLTECTSASENWAVFQMHRSDIGKGMLLAFRRQNSPYLSADFRLQALDPEAQYEMEDADSGQKWHQRGQELMKSGVRLAMNNLPSSRLVFYNRVS